MASILKEFAASSIEAIKNITIMDNDESKNTIPPSPPKLPPLQARKAACTHINVSRLYGPYHTCSHCGKTSEFGWVYRCTQDYNGQLPPWEGGPMPNMKESSSESARIDGVVSAMEALTSSAPHAENVNDTPPPEEPEVKLKPWMEKAVAEGHYTPEEVQALRYQRKQVLEKIKESEEAFKHHHTVSNKRLSGASARRFSHRNTVITGLGIAFPSIQPAEDDQVPPSVTLKMFPDCSYKACQSCRPILRDRAWLSVDQAYESTDNPVPDTERDNRPVVNAVVVRDLGQWEAYTDDSSYESTPFDRAATGDLVDSNDNPPRPLRRLSTSIARSLKRGFRSLSISSEKRSRSASAKLSSESKRNEDWAIERRRLAQASTESDMTYMPPLQRQSARLNHGDLNMTHPDANEVHTPDGVAVTEEAVDLGTADIITQA